MQWLQPGDGEETAALRLLARLPQLCGSRFFDILLICSVLKLILQEVMLVWDAFRYKEASHARGSNADGNVPNTGQWFAGWQHS
jgi:hypothetical protein